MTRSCGRLTAGSKGRACNSSRGTAVTDMAIASRAEVLQVRELVLDRDGRKARNVQLEDGDLVFFQNGSMTDASSSGSMTSRLRA